MNCTACTTVRYKTNRNSIDRRLSIHHHQHHHHHQHCTAKKKGAKRREMRALVCIVLLLTVDWALEVLYL